MTFSWIKNLFTGDPEKQPDVEGTHPDDAPLADTADIEADLSGDPIPDEPDSYVPLDSEDEDKALVGRVADGIPGDDELEQLSSTEDEHEGYEL